MTFFQKSSWEDLSGGVSGRKTLKRLPKVIMYRKTLTFVLIVIGSHLQLFSKEVI